MKKRVSVKKKLVDNKRTTDKKESTGSNAGVTKLKQTTLSESFGRCSLRARLRPRMNTKNYKDSSTDSVLLEKSISPEKRKSFVLLRNMNDDEDEDEDDGKTETKKLPVYKTCKIKDKSTEDKESVYDFQFDNNDPDEKPAAKLKRKKKVNRKPPATKKKKTNLSQKNHNNNNNNNEPTKKTEQHSDNHLDKKETTVAPLETEEDVTKILKQVEPKSPRVRICSIETLPDDRKVSFVTNRAKFNPFRSTHSIFKPRSTMVVKDMMEHSLLNKSLSPIKKKGCEETFDPASPWRPPLPATFSSVKQIVQSTPQIRKNSARITQLGFKIDEKDEGRDESEDAKRTRKPLGVRMPNAENIQAGDSKKRETLTGSVPKIGRERKPLGVATHYGDNKANTGFADRLYKSPKKNDKGVTTLSHGSPGVKKRNNLKVAADGTQDLAPRKIDSGLVADKDENSPPFVEGETRLFKQSNLNTFLNIDQMPESISINTSHGIFGDMRSTPVVVSSQTPRVQAPGNIENCFGFEEDCDSEANVSSNKLDRKQTTPVRKIAKLNKGRALNKDKEKHLGGAARISLGEIKNTLYRPRKEKKFDNKPEVRDDEKNSRGAQGTEIKKDTRGPKVDKKYKPKFDPVDFSDTFDVLSESVNGDEREKSLGTEIALFADLEPVHFTQPPRWSYAKKRERKQYWSSDEDDNYNGKDRDAPVLKKRKLAKINKIEEKKIDEWVKSVNETFQEIDDFDLVVEKLT